jgi:hypothetical protein
MFVGFIMAKLFTLEIEFNGNSRALEVDRSLLSGMLKTLLIYIISNH